LTSDEEASADENASAEETEAAVLAARFVAVSTALRLRISGAHRRRAYVGSVPGRRANRDRDFEGGMRRIMADYFGLDGSEPVYDEANFERRFRVPRVVFERIFADIKEQPFWRQTVNAMGRPQAYALQKLVPAFRVLAFGETYDCADEYVRLSKATIEICVKKLLDFLNTRFQPDYLRPPTKTELNAIMERSAARGPPGCIGSLDCTHWEWRGCLKALVGQYMSRQKRRAIVLVTICDHDLYVHHLFVGAPGSHHDLNVLGQSPLFMDMMDGAWPPKDLPYTVNGRTRTMPYYLTNKAYQKFPVFLSCYAKPATRKQRIFNRLQEAVRKDVEHLYGVLTSRFQMLLRPSRFTTVTQMIKAVKAMESLHNMILFERRGYVLSNGRVYAAAVARSGGCGSDDGMGSGGVGGGIAAAPTLGSAAAGGDDSAGSGCDGGRDGGMWSGAMGGGVAAPPTLGSAHAGGDNPVGRGGGAGHGGVVHAQLEPLPGGSMPDVRIGMDAPPRSFLFFLHAGAACTDNDAFVTLRDDLAEHVYGKRGVLLARYL